MADDVEIRINRVAGCGACQCQHGAPRSFSPDEQRKAVPAQSPGDFPEAILDRDRARTSPCKCGAPAASSPEGREKERAMNDVVSLECPHEGVALVTMTNPAIANFSSWGPIAQLARVLREAREGGGSAPSECPCCPDLPSR